MNDLKNSLKSCNYTGPCINEHYLQWALRTGACSQFFLDLLYWLEQQLHVVSSTPHVRENIQRLFSMLRQSILMHPSYGSEAAINPKEFRLQTLKVLVRQLELRKKSKQSHNLDESPQRGNGNVRVFNDIKITLNMAKKSISGDWNERQVRLNPKFLEVFQ